MFGINYFNNNTSCSNKFYINRSCVKIYSFHKYELIKFCRELTQLLFFQNVLLTRLKFTFMSHFLGYFVFQFPCAFHLYD